MKIRMTPRVNDVVSSASGGSQKGRAATVTNEMNEAAVHAKQRTELPSWITSGIPALSL